MIGHCIYKMQILIAVTMELLAVCLSILKLVIRLLTIN